ncbi:MAG: hypothetical protein ACRDE2_16910, partial [Chitinophagaceae bacterium]
MKFKALLFIMVILTSTTRESFSQSQHKTKNLVLILIDGYRWQELFHGAEQYLLMNPRYNTMDSLQRMKEFWSDNVNER